MIMMVVVAVTGPPALGAARGIQYTTVRVVQTFSFGGAGRFRKA